MQKITLHISGMTCASCAKLSEKAILSVKGVKKVNVNIVNNKAIVEFENTTIEQIIEAIKKAGYGAKKDDNNDRASDESKTIKKFRNRFIGALIFTLPIMSMMFVETTNFTWIYALLTAIVVLGFGGHFHVSAFKKLRILNFNMDSLISMGTLTAFFYSMWAMISYNHIYFEAAASIITLVNLGKWFEAKSKGKAGQAIKKLLEISVKNARIIKNGKEVEIPIEEIQVGDILHVKAGEKIALDGVIEFGEAHINESMLTGESIPTKKHKGDKVFGATINQNGNIKVKVTRVGKDTILSQIIKLVEDAQASKAPIQKLADKISGIFVPIVILIGLGTFVSWYIITGNITQSVLPAVAVLVIACPCALGLATPTAIMVGTGKGAQLGILIKNSETLEKSNHIDTVIFDKTGTLTEGKPRVTDIIPFNFPKEKLIKIAYNLSKLSNHPLSQAIAELSKKYEIPEVKFEKFKEISGKGLIAKCETHKTDLLLGNDKLLRDNGVEFDEKISEKLSKEGKTPILVVHGGKFIGALGLMDTEKKDSAKTIKELKKMGIKPMMITGDNRKTAKAIASKLGIEEIIAEVLPEDKSKSVKKLQKDGLRVAFVGDGINDAPALAQADLGIAMGTGTDIAIETGNIILMHGSPEKVLTAIKLSQRTFRTIKQNLFWAFIYNIIGIPIAALGLLNPIFASFAMSMSSVSVVTNSLRIKKFK